MAGSNPAGVATHNVRLLFINGLVANLANLSAALANVCSRSFHRLARISLIDGLGIPLDFSQALMAANRRDLVHRAASLSQAPASRFSQSMRRAVLWQSCLRAAVAEPVAEARWRKWPPLFGQEKSQIVGRAGKCGSQFGVGRDF